VLSPASREGKELTVSKHDDVALLRRRKQNEAIAYALQGDWANATDTNTAMLYDGLSIEDIELTKDPESESGSETTIGDLVAKSTDVETLNRLAKAQYELGNEEFARQIYQRVLSVNENNPIAKRMILLLDHVSTRINPRDSKMRHFADMRTFVVETGKSTITTMHIDQGDAIALVPGEIVEMRLVGTPSNKPISDKPSSKGRSSKKAPRDSESEEPIVALPETVDPENAHAIDIYDADNVLLGRLDPRLAQRIIDFMRKGNKYIAVVWRLSEHYRMVDLIIRESYRHPDLTGSVSFPGKLNDDEKSALMDLADEDIDDANVDETYPLDIEEEATTRLSSYDDDDDSFDGGDDNTEDEVDDFAAPKKGKASGRSNSSSMISLDEVQRDETRKNTDRETEDE
jgi:hypothetical protein